MYYYRWWTLRKHIKETPVGYGMTEFLVNGSYADKYNLIACAIGHHIYESRWLRNPEYLNQIIPVSYTHLAVYKRQEYDRACRGCPRRRVGLVWC